MSAGGPFQDRPGLRAEALTLVRGGRVLFEALSFAAPGGAFVEIRGPNGVGKSSLLRALAGLLKPRAGRVVFERVIDEPALALHYLGHLNGLKPTESAIGHVRTWRGLYGGRGDEEAALRQVGLGSMREAPARALSQGQARRLALTCLLVAERPIWLLDEPAAGLDASGRATLDAMIAAHRGQGGVVIAALHEPLSPASLVVDLAERP